MRRFLLILLIFCFSLNAFASSVSTNTSANKLVKQTRLFGDRLSAYDLNYLLPSYNSEMPNQADDIFKSVPIAAVEVKFQISSQVNLWDKIFGSPLSLHAFYTQLSYWQAYSKSAYFRETNYNPGTFLRYTFGSHNGSGVPWLRYVDLGWMHQSNGRGLSKERSWNRLFANVYFNIGSHFSILLRPWVRTHAARDYNPQINRYLGYGSIHLKFHSDNVAVIAIFRNEFESGFSRGAEELDVVFPLYGGLKGFAQIFSGFGQSLISYDHFTNAVGIGVSVSFSGHA